MFCCIALLVSSIYAINVVWYRHLSIESKKEKDILYVTVSKRLL